MIHKELEEHNSLQRVNENRCSVPIDGLKNICLLSLASIPRQHPIDLTESSFMAELHITSPTAKPDTAYSLFSFHKP